MLSGTMEYNLKPANKKSFSEIAESISARYKIDFQTLEYDGAFLKDVTEKFNVDCVFFIHHLSASIQHEYKSNIIVEYLEGKYDVISAKDATEQQLHINSSYFAEHGHEFKGWIFDYWLEYFCVNTLLFRHTMHVSTVPVTYPKVLQNDVVVNDLCASSYDRFMNPNRAAFYSFNLEMLQNLSLDQDLEISADVEQSIEQGF
ncbi:hypothetical protein [Photobacterium leiognathi]|uniref:hypothetical protein n=1 Tax=Photobacterium leiognathi TaxID=553611 RepID=UPI002981FCB1|nr:hypothetical protein [Photobacterium leiognathi]